MVLVNFVVDFWHMIVVSYFEMPLMKLKYLPLLNLPVYLVSVLVIIGKLVWEEDWDSYRPRIISILSILLILISFITHIVVIKT